MENTKNVVQTAPKLPKLQLKKVTLKIESLEDKLDPCGGLARNAPLTETNIAKCKHGGLIAAVADY